MCFWLEGWIKQICLLSVQNNRQRGGLPFGRTFSTLFSQLPMVRPEMFVLLEQKKSFLDWEIQTNGSVPALWRLPNPSCFGMFICVGLWSLLPRLRSQNYRGSLLLLHSFFSSVKKNKVCLTCSTEYFVFWSYLSFLLNFLVTIIKQWVTIHEKDPRIFPLRGMLPWFQLS